MHLISTCAPSTKPKPYGRSSDLFKSFKQIPAPTPVGRLYLIERLYIRLSMLLASPCFSHSPNPANSSHLSSTSQDMVSYSGYRGLSLPTSNPPHHLTEFEVPTMDYCPMLEPQLSGSRRKRQRSEPPRLNKTSQPVRKKQRLRRLSHTSGSQSTSASGDNLSEIGLTKRALRELDRRNFRAELRVRWLFTRNLLAQSERSCETAQYTADSLRPCLRRCETIFSEEIRLLARNGGPDLSDLRNVCTASYLLAPMLTTLCSTLNLSIIPVAR